MTRLPFEPLLSLIDGRDDQTVAEIVGVERSTVASWRRAGSLPLMRADKVAIRLGSHPILVWPTFDPRR